jgi:hypothetical protein
MFLGIISSPLRLDVQEFHLRMEFLDINLRKDLILMRHANHNPFYWRISKKTPYSSLVLKILTKKTSKHENSSLFMNSIF